MKIKLLLPLLLALVFGTMQNTHAATITVTNNSDAGAGSLRAAIDSAASGDTITFAVRGNIFLDSTIIWSETLTIIGPGPDSLTIDGNNSTNMFQTNSGRNLIFGITFNHGNGPTGACILANNGSRTDSTILLDCVFKNSYSSDEASAVEADGSILIMDYCTVDSCVNNHIGAVALFGGAILNTTFSNCVATTEAGAIWAFEDSVAIINCTFYNNTAGGGAAIVDEIRFGKLRLVNNTFDNNHASDGGSCLFVSITGGISKDTVIFENNIFKGDSNFYVSNTHSYTGVSLGGNICSDGTMAGFLTGTNDMNNTNPGLDSVAGLANKGGPTKTVALLCSSLAINNGISAGAPLTDQRGIAWTGTPDAGSYYFNDSLKLTQSVTICANSSIVIGGTIVHTAAGTYVDTIPSTGGCDSIVTTTLTVYQIDTSVTLSGITLTATAGTGKTYQWLSCSNNNQPVAGATSQTFTPAQTGTYAVAETQNSCTDTSSCYYVIVSGIETITAGMDVNIYPNPTSNTLIVDYGKVITSGYVRVLDMVGHVLLERPAGANNKMEINMMPYTSGIYFIEISENNSITRSRVVKN